MKRFGTVFPFLEQGLQNQRIGRLVANHQFIKALLLHGSFDQYFFSNPSENNLKVFKKTVEQWGLPDGLRNRNVYVPYSKLISTLQSVSFQVFHLGGWGYFMPGLHYLRNQYACNSWPITGVIHSLNGRQVIDQAVRLSHAQMASYDSVICTSLDGQQALGNLLASAGALTGKSYRGRLDHLPLGIDDDWGQADGNRGPMRQAMNIPEDALVFLVLGRITPFHKMDLAPLLIYFSNHLIPSLKKQVFLVIAGGAESGDLQILQQQIETYHLEANVRIRANFRPELKTDLLAAADIFLALSDNTQETFGLSILEAQCAGLPVIASRFDGFKDLVRDGIDGFLVDTYWSSMDPMKDLSDLMDPNVAQLFQAQGVAIDLNQLHQKVMLLAENQELRKAIGEIGRNKVRREFLWSKVIQRYERLWDQLSQEASAVGLLNDYENPFNFDQFQIFGHYATRPLMLDDRLEPLPFGSFPTPYEELQSLIDECSVEGIWEIAKEKLQVQDLIARLHLPQEQAWLVITWMIKYHLLKVVPGGTSRED
jgi:glycosyltransferase involved in cell wall biosynthesis